MPGPYAIPAVMRAVPLKFFNPTRRIECQFATVHKHDRVCAKHTEARPVERVVCAMTALGRTEFLFFLRRGGQHEELMRGAKRLDALVVRQAGDVRTI